MVLGIIGCSAVPKTSVSVTAESPQQSGVSNDLYQSALTKAVRENGSVDFLKLYTDTNLTAYINQIAKIRSSAFVSRPSQLAFWINAHNAYVLDIIRSNGRRSPKDISGFFSGDAVIIGDQKFSLYSVEHNVIGKQFREPRAFFALYVGAKSGPRLLDQPYEEVHLSDQLDQAVKAFLTNTANCKLDKKNNTIIVSGFVSEFEEEIEGSTGSMLAFLRAFAPSEIASYIDSHPNAHVAYQSTDWTLF